MPSFDLVRVEPNGEAVVAGRASPRATVLLVVDGREHARAVADGTGAFAIVADPIPPGSHGVVIEAIAADGSRGVSAQTVTVALAENRRDPPLVTVAAPGRPTVIVSRPDAPGPVASAPPSLNPAPALPAAEPPRPVAAAPPSSTPAARAEAPVGVAPPAAGPAAAPPEPAARPVIRIESVEVEAPGRLYVSGRGAPGATVRLYLNDALVATGVAAADGRISFAIERGLRAGRYRVRLDEAGPGGGRVASRAEVPFDMPSTAVASTEPTAPAGSAPPNAPPWPAPDPAAAAPVRAAQAPATGGSLPPPAAAAPPASASPPRHVAAVPPASIPDAPPVAQPRTPAPASAVPARRAATVTVATVSTATVTRGESLWAISQRLYGDGHRYTVIYGANSGQIRDPNLIYPGQVFVMPAR